MVNFFIKTTLIIAMSLVALASAHAANFTIIDGQTVTTQQTLNDSETGTIDLGGTLNSVSSSAVNASGDNVTVTNGGSISTVNDGVEAIDSSGANATITNSGVISTTGIGAEGIFSNDTNVSIINSGNILTLGNVAEGIDSSGANATIINSGFISTAGDSAEGVYSSGTNAIITNSGSISTVTSGTEGIELRGSDATITNSGSISTAGFGAEGIAVKGTATNANIINSGVISTTGDSAEAIASNIADTIITNSGKISTQGNSAEGIGVNGAATNATITNSGVISTTGDSAEAIDLTGANATIVNSGSIFTQGNSAEGIGVNGAATNATITNSGVISTTGNSAEGIDLFGANATIVNSGSIFTQGNSAEGIGVNGTATNATITNSGVISTTGDSAEAIGSSGADTTITNSGLISATGTNALAISGGSNDITLNLLAGSQIIGAIDLGDNGGDNDTANIYGGSVSANLVFQNVENINLFGAGVVNGNTVTTVDATGESTRSMTLERLTSSIHTVVSQRMAYTTPLKPIQLATLTLSPGMLFQQRKPVVWAQIFGGTFNRDSEGTVLAYNHEQVGFTVGYEWDVNSNRIGLIGGIAHAETETDAASFETEADSYYIGTYGHFNLDSVNLTVSLLGGFSDHDNDRLVIDNINGAEVAESDFGSIFFSPSVTLSSAYSVADKLELRPSVRAAYSVAWLDSYRESGTTNSNLKIGSRTIQVLTTGVQLAAAYQLDQSSEFEFRVGVNSRHTDDDDTQANLAGSDFRFANAGDEDVTGRYAGVNLRVATEDNLSLMADVEFGGNSDEDYVNGNISLEYSF